MVCGEQINDLETVDGVFMVVLQRSLSYWHLAPIGYCNCFPALCWLLFWEMHRLTGMRSLESVP